MKIRSIAISTFLVVIILIASRFKMAGPMYESGPPAGVTGSPGDGSSCTSCHGGSATSALNFITSDIPATGYVPGATYNVTATISHASFNKFGFQVSPQNSTGQQKGTLIVTDAARTQLTGGTKYIMHKTAGTAGMSNSNTWSFQWKAPAAGSDNVTLYGGFVKANANGQSSGDAVFVSQLAVIEDLSTGVNENEAVVAEWSVYPMPCSNELTVSLTDNTQQKIRILIRSIDGKVVQEDVIENTNGKLKLNTNELAKGTYVLTVFEAERSLSKKIVKL